MKKKLTLLICSAILLCSCNNNNSQLKEVNIDINTDIYGTFEWVSPDGVHYWVVNSYYKIGIMPRYDNNGNLVIDKKE